MELTVWRKIPAPLRGAGEWRRVRRVPLRGYPTLLTFDGYAVKKSGVPGDWLANDGCRLADHGLRLAIRDSALATFLWRAGTGNLPTPSGMGFVRYPHRGCSVPAENTPPGHCRL